MTLATAIVALVLAAGSLLVAAWAATTAHRARKWQEARDREKKQTNISVSFFHANRPPSVGIWVEGGPQPPDRYTLTVAVTNHGLATEFVTAVFVREVAEEHGRRGIKIFGDETGATQHELPPRGRHAIDTQPDTEALLWMARGFVAEVWLGSGLTAESEPEYLNETILATLA